MLVPVLLSGGVGSRLWPVSRELFPKQFLALLNDQESMLQQTMLRLDGLDTTPKPLVVCNEDHRFLVAEQLRSLGQSAQIILEPAARNTAPAIALAALKALEQDKNPALLVLPADHDIQLTEQFHQAVEQGLPLALDGKLVTFGIVPDKPETGYGYIQQGGKIGEQAFSIDRFVEKPNLETAQQYVDSGEYLWNSGMFLLSAKTYLAELEQHNPQMLQLCQQALSKAQSDMDFVRVDETSFAAIEEDSIDYAVMEKTQQGVVIPLACGWSDVGAWSTLWEVSEKDADGNVCKGDAIVKQTQDSYIRSESRLVATLGLKDTIVVETADAVLVADKNQVQDIKQIVNALKTQARSETSSHSRVYRPWGSYESLVETDRFQVKRIVVNPGQTLSLQMHHHRAEHWVVVKGTAEITNGDDVRLYSEDQSTYIPLGHKHRLANPGVIPLEIIEIQTGSYLGEDDIVRFEDVYGREQ